MKARQILKSYAEGGSLEDLIEEIKALKPLGPTEPWNEDRDIEGTTLELMLEAWHLGFTPTEYNLLMEIVREARRDTG